MAYVKVKEVTTNSAEITVTGLEKVNYARIFYFYLNDDKYYGSNSLAGGESKDVSYTYTKLKPDTFYTIKVSVCRASNGQWLTNLEGSFQTKAIPILPWTWNDCQTIDGDTGEASASETIKAYNAIIDHDSIINFSHKVWNDLCAKTLEIRRADKDISIEWKTSQNGYNFLSYNDTLMSDSDTFVTAARFNSLRINIGSMVTLSGIPFPAVANETIVYGQYFLTLAEGLNTAIDNL